MNKQVFIDEIGSRGTINIAKLPTDFSEREWWIFQTTLMYVDLPYGIVIANIDQHNPPTETSDITFQERIGEEQYNVDSLPEDYLIAKINELPFVVAVTFVTKKEDGSELTGTKIFIDGIEKGET